jgi:hypothetical protein
MRRLYFAAAAALLGCVLGHDPRTPSPSTAPTSAAASTPERRHQPLVSSRMEFGPGGRTFTRRTCRTPDGTERTTTQAYGCRGTRAQFACTAPYPSGGVYEEDGTTTADGCHAPPPPLADVAHELPPHAGRRPVRTALTASRRPVPNATRPRRVVRPPDRRARHHGRRAARRGRPLWPGEGRQRCASCRAAVAGATIGTVQLADTLVLAADGNHWQNSVTREPTAGAGPSTATTARGRRSSRLPNPPRELPDRRPLAVHHSPTRYTRAASHVVPRTVTARPASTSSTRPPACSRGSCAWA